MVALTDGLCRVYTFGSGISIGPGVSRFDRSNDRNAVMQMTGSLSQAANTR
jgi:hypothetical protein